MPSKTLRSYIRYTALAGFGLCTMVSQAFAQSSQIGIFQPAGMWAVGPAQLPSMRGLEGMSLPCVLSNEYDNGFIVRFSGGGQQILAMAIDFRQNIFRPGRKYTAMLTLDGNYSKQVSGSAFAANTLIFNLRDLDGFYQKVSSASQMELNIAENAMKFSLGSIGSAYPALEQCYGGGEITTDAPASVAQQPAPSRGGRGINVPHIPAPNVMPMPQSFDEIVQGDVAANAAPMPITNSMAAGSISRMPGGMPQWNASAGEDMQVVLKRWADRAGYDLEWQAMGGGVVAQDIAMDGSFEEAVSQLLAMNGAGAGLASRIDQPSFPSAGMKARAAGGAGDWIAPASSDFHTVVTQWANQAGVRVVWNSQVNAPIKRAVTMAGPFEAALQALLSQYENDSVRPVGQLNTDPDSGTRTLTIDVDRAG